MCHKSLERQTVLSVTHLVSEPVVMLSLPEIYVLSWLFAHQMQKAHLLASGIDTEGSNVPAM